MRYLPWLVLPFAGAVAVGCLLPDWWLVFLLLLPFLGLGLLLRHLWQEGRMAVTLATLGACLGLLWFGLYSALWVQPGVGLHSRELGFEATVLTYPQEADWGCQVTVELESGAEGQKALLYLSGDWGHLQPGDRVRGEGEFTSALEGELRWTAGDGVFLTLSGQLDSAIRSDAGSSLRYLPQRLGQRLKSAIDTLVSPAPAALLRGLITGDTSRLSEETFSDFRRSGMVHLLSVSGLHIGFLAALLTRRPGSRRWHAFIILPVLVLFALMTGGEPPVWRSVIMIGFVLLAPLVRREPDQATALCGALLVLLVQNPYAITGVSLQLSFAAVAGLACFYPRMYAFLIRPVASPDRERRWTARVWRFVAQSLAVSLCATVFTLPLLAWHFGEFSLIAPLANLVCLGLGTLCFGLGLVTCLFYRLIPPLGELCVLVLELALRLLTALAEWFAGFTWSALPVDNLYYTVWLVAACLIFGLMMVIRPLARRPVLPVSAVFALLLLAMTLRTTSVSDVALSVTALDVGQGSCTVFASRGDFLAVDCGGSQAGDALANYIQGDGRVDVLVLTHYDDDHVDGLAQLLRRVEVGTLALPRVEDPSGNRQAVEELARKNGIHLLWVEETVCVTFGAASACIFPPVSSGSDNASGLSVLCSLGDWDALVTGDLPASAERELVEREGLRDVELLVAGHHGAASSSCDALLAALQPEIALISVGDNQYHLPSDETLRRLSDYHCAIYRTNQNGAVTIRIREE